MNFWVMLSNSDPGRGPLSYGDEETVYRYDNKVPNHKQVSPGDVAFRIEDDVRLSLGKVQRVDVSEGRKQLFRCPRCGSASTKRRRHHGYCDPCRAPFDEPVIDEVAVRQYAAHFDPLVHVDSPRAWIQFVKDAATGSQISIRRLDTASMPAPIRRLMVESLDLNIPHPHTDILHDLPVEAWKPKTEEGRRRLVTHLRIERSATAASQAKRRHLANDPRCSCEACGFSFSDMYGDHGSNYIEAHHRIPLSDLETPKAPVAADFALVCANCHRMLHRTRDLQLTVEELARLIRRRFD